MSETKGKVMKTMRRALSIILMMVVCMASLVGCTGRMPNEEVGTVEGVTVVSGTIGKPVQGTIAYAPTDATGFFAVNGTLKVQTTVRVCADPNGVLHFDLVLDLASDRESDVEIQVFKGGRQLASYSEEGLSLPAGDTEINARIDTGEDAPCSGEYTVRFYIDGQLVNETTGTV